MKKYKEYLLSTDNFKNPVLKEGNDATGLLIMRLLILDPGTNRRHPSMGIGMLSKLFSSSSDILNLQENIDSQMNTYMPPDIRPSEIKLTGNKKGFLEIHIVVKDIDYIYETENTSNPISIKDL